MLEAFFVVVVVFCIILHRRLIYLLSVKILLSK